MGLRFLRPLVQYITQELQEKLKDRVDPDELGLIIDEILTQKPKVTPAPLSGYRLYMNKNKARVRDEEPNGRPMNHSQVMIAVNKLWSSEPESVQLEYRNRAIALAESAKATAATPTTPKNLSIDDDSEESDSEYDE